MNGYMWPYADDPGISEAGWGVTGYMWPSMDISSNLSYCKYSVRVEVRRGYMRPSVDISRNMAICRYSGSGHGVYIAIYVYT